VTEVRLRAHRGEDVVMSEDVQQALANDRVVDITTIGKQSGEPRRIEIWFHRVGERLYITGRPPRPRAWYANLVANPRFTFHLKESATADLTATARPITETAEREQVFDGIFAQLPQLTADADARREDWLAQSPLVEVQLDAA
jgi:deazaflavin-dependent oxidoreductase (nitroreductase family)